MTEEETLEKLKQMKLHVMTQTFQELLHAAPSDQLSFGEKFGLIVDREWTARENRKLDRLLRAAKLTGNASAEDVVCSPERGLEKSLLRELATCRWVHAKQNVIVVGKTGVGKSFIGCALATTACRKGYRTLVTRVPRLVQELAVARAEGSYATVLARLAKLDILILDDFLSTACEIIREAGGYKLTERILVVDKVDFESWRQLKKGLARSEELASPRNGGKRRTVMERERRPATRSRRPKVESVGERSIGLPEIRPTQPRRRRR